jgi:hypothetical protein
LITTEIEVPSVSRFSDPQTIRLSNRSAPISTASTSYSLQFGFSESSLMNSAITLSGALEA